MDSATEIDLAKQEVPATQAVQSALEDAAAHLGQDLNVSGPSIPTSPRKQARGASATSNQIRLKPRSSERSPSPLSQKGNFTRLESGSFGPGGAESELQPTDRGFGAWSYVASTFAMYIVIWGFPQAFPIFQTYLSTGKDAKYPGSVAVRLLAPGLQDIEEGILFPFLPKSSKYRQAIVITGIVTISVSVFLASIADTDWQVVLFQGVLFGIGGILMNYVHVSIFPEWFDKKKGQAMGIIWTGWRVGALAFPLICQSLLDKHGFTKTLQVLLAPMLALLLPSIILLRGRYHAATITSQPTNPAVSRLEALRAPNVLLTLFATCLFYLVVNVPKMFVTNFAADLGLEGSEQALTLSLLVLSDMVGTYFFGWLSDTVYHQGLTASIAMATSVSHLFGLGFARTRVGVFLYAAAVGLASGGFSNCLFTFFGDVSGKDGELFTAVHSLFSFFRGAAILSVGPVGAALLLKSPDVDTSKYAIGKYQSLAVYASTLSMASGLLLLSHMVYRKSKARVAPVRQTNLSSADRDRQ